MNTATILLFVLWAVAASADAAVTIIEPENAPDGCVITSGNWTSGPAPYQGPGFSGGINYTTDDGKAHSINIGGFSIQSIGDFQIEIWITNGEHEYGDNYWVLTPDGQIGLSSLPWHASDPYFTIHLDGAYSPQDQSWSGTWSIKRNDCHDEVTVPESGPPLAMMAGLLLGSAILRRRNL